MSSGSRPCRPSRRSERRRAPEGTPELMAVYADLAINAGARIIGGCCGTSPEHLAAMRRALDTHVEGMRPDLDQVVTALGPLTSPPAREDAGRVKRESRRRG